MEAKEKSNSLDSTLNFGNSRKKRGVHNKRKKGKKGATNVL
uniref:Uncharacterized protein n=1 Tax=Chlorella vulgaris TaxID=3077 RepID=A0A8A2F3Z5_CHLVU|nr:hypothetical protein [Chlorella vulgaris]